jgi:HNH endonuclease
MSNLNFTRLNELLKYDPDTGIFTWINNMGKRVKAGSKTGCLHHTGYLQSRIDGKNYLCHRLAWLYVYGEFPELNLDHIDSNKTNNCIANLREVTQAQNCQNLKKSRGSSGFLGVSLDPIRKNRWKSSIKLNGKSKHLGWYKTPEQAHEVYKSAKLLIHPFGTI